MAAEMKYGDYISGGWGIVKANLVMAAVCLLVMGIVGSITFGILMPLLMVNFMSMIKAAKQEGKPIDIGGLFNFDNAVDKIVAPFIVGFLAFLGNFCIVGGLIVGGLFFFTVPILADKPGTPWMNALKGSLAFGKANLVPSILLALVVGIVGGLGTIACYVGIFVTAPIAIAAQWLAYEDHKSAIESAAAAEGVQL